MKRSLLAALALALSCVLAPSVTSAQQPQEDPERWRTEGELGASMFFGNTEQTALTTRASVTSLGRSREFSTDAMFTYGETSTEEGDDVVNKRSWRVGMDLDPDPGARVTPFLSGRAEGSYEKRIDLRWSVGVGGKVRVVEGSDATRLELSLAVLAERTFPTERALDDADDELEAIWSARVRARRELSEGRVTLQSETHYQPTFDRIDDFTLTSTSSLAFALTEVVSLKLTFVDNYDSGAIERGARTNNDGQFFVSVLSAF